MNSKSSPHHKYKVAESAMIVIIGDKTGSSNLDDIHYNNERAEEVSADLTVLQNIRKTAVSGDAGENDGSEKPNVTRLGSCSSINMINCLTPSSKSVTAEKNIVSFVDNNAIDLLKSKLKCATTASTSTNTTSDNLNLIDDSKINIKHDTSSDNLCVVKYDNNEIDSSLSSLTNCDNFDLKTQSNEQDASCSLFSGKSKEDSMLRRNYMSMLSSCFNRISVNDSSTQSPSRDCNSTNNNEQKDYNAPHNEQKDYMKQTTTSCNTATKDYKELSQSNNGSNENRKTRSSFGRQFSNFISMTFRRGRQSNGSSDIVIPEISLMSSSITHYGLNFSGLKNSKPKHSSQSSSNWSDSKISKPRQRDRDGFRLRAACVCVRNADEDEVLLITSSKHSDRWVIPGGGIERGEDGMRAAMRETEEEAGVIGLITRLLGTFENKESAHRTLVYVMIVEQELLNWDEKDQGRERKWFKFEDAKRMLSITKPSQVCYLESLERQNNMRLI
ncbi:hypothetical protein GJ496_001308 [Pomphorhynchus laevis]|nr:hypothetical protein GJ496_001308 [Pomphorhynchus laevis]